MYFENYDTESVVTPVKADILEHLLVEAGYDRAKTRFLVNGFQNGFSIHYQGPSNVRIKSPNLKLTVGDEVDLWNKVMKEVKLKRFAGPYKESEIPFQNFIQSPIGLVPKDGGRDTRLIFHLSYPRAKNSSSVNAHIPAEFCKVKYPDFSEAVRLCMEHKGVFYAGKSDMKSAFRNLGVSKKFWKYLLMKCKSPLDGQWYYFFDKAVPFGCAISCALFQDFSDAVAFLVTHKTGKKLINYLDDFFFVALLKWWCDMQMTIFLNICERINFPVSLEKTFWGDTQVTFLGFLIDTVARLVLLPCEKIAKARNMLVSIRNQKRVGKPHKMKVVQLQKICGYLNFLCKAIVPGRAFTRRLYSHLCGNNLKLHHHIRVTAEMLADFAMWEIFLLEPAAYAAPFLDFAEMLQASEINFYTDASKQRFLGFGGFCDSSWMQQRWGCDFIQFCNPSIEYLELFAVVAAVLAWIDRFRNRRVILFVDNESVKFMINKNSTGCKHCMTLIRLMVLHCMKLNVRVYAKHVGTKLNGIADSLSRFQNARFRRLTRKRNMDPFPTAVPKAIWPISKVWFS